MKYRTKLTFALLSLALASFVAPVVADDQPGKTNRPALYDRQADGKKQIADALAQAKKEGKHVLLQFGANWCGWCHKLHKLFKDDKEIAAYLAANYVVVLVDVDKVDGKSHNDDVNQRYDNPCQFGLPALVVLDADGKKLTMQDTGKLEQGNHHDPKKVMGFLKEWGPKGKAKS
jgi:thioredoxin-related protein